MFPLVNLGSVKGCGRRGLGPSKSVGHPALKPCTKPIFHNTSLPMRVDDRGRISDQCGMEGRATGLAGQQNDVAWDNLLRRDQEGLGGLKDIFVKAASAWERTTQITGDAFNQACAIGADPAHAASHTKWRPKPKAGTGYCK
jgi:hypothetical protein